MALLIGVVVILVAIVGVVILSGGGGGGGDEPLADIAISGNTETLTLTHNGGSALDPANVEVFLRGDTESSQFTMGPANISGSDGEFSVGDTLSRQHGIDDPTMRVLVVHRPSNSVLAETTLTLRSPGADQQYPFSLIWETAADWDSAARSDGSLVHADVGDHRATRVQLGHPPDTSGIVAYWTLDEIAGATAVDASPYSNDATVVSATRGGTGVFGTTSYTFDGSSSILNVSNSTSLNTIARRDAASFSAWVNTGDTSDEAFLWSQFDGLNRTSDEDIAFGLRDGRPAVFPGTAAAVERERTVTSQADYRRGSFTDTDVEGETLQLGQTEGVEHGQFEVPNETGSVSVTTDFEPDVVVFRTVVTHREFNETANVGPAQVGGGKGFAAWDGTQFVERAQTVGTGSSSPNAGASGATATHSIFQTVPAGVDGTGTGYLVRGTVSSRNIDGFTVEFDQVIEEADIDPPPNVQVVYSAYGLPDSAEVDVGSFQTRNASAANPTGRQHVDAGFEPNYVHLLTGPSVQQNGDLEDGSREEWGWSQGWSINNESRSLTPDVTTLGETGTFNQTANRSTTMVGETGAFTTSDGTWQTVSFDNSYTNPVVVGTVATENESEHAITFDARNVQSGQAEMRVCELEGDADGCDTHGTETASYVVVDAAVVDQVPGLDAGTYTADRGIDQVRTTVNFGESFATARVFANVNSANGAQPVEARVTSVGGGSFQAGICHLDGEDSCDSGHGQETVGWVAIEQGTSVFDQQVEVGAVDTSGSNWERQSFASSFSSPPGIVVSTQTENGGQEVQVDEARDVTTGAADVRFCEMEGDQPDTCDTHTTETVAWLAVESGVDLTTTTEAPRWINVTFDNTYTDPVIVGTTNTENESEHAVTFQARNVTGTTADVRLCELEGDAAGCDPHDVERGGYVVIDAADADEVAGIEAGTRAIDSGVNDNRESISLTEAYSQPPVVLANTQTTNGVQPVEARLPSVTTTGFEAGICKQDGQDGCDSGHVSETVGWVTLSRSGLPFDGPAQVGRTPPLESSEWTNVSLTAGFSQRPVVVAEVQTEAGGQDSLVDEVRNVSMTNAEVRYCEMQGLDPDTCDAHNGEDVGWLAVQNDTTLTRTVGARRTQVVMSQSAHADDVNYHVYAASDRQIIHTLFAQKDASSNETAIAGRIEAYLAGYNSTGFTLDYERNNPDGRDGDEFVVSYLAIRMPGDHPELGWARTPETTGTQNLSVTRAVSDLSITASNAIPDVNTEGWSGDNAADANLGWMYGGGTVGDGTPGTGVAGGYSTHSASVNAHATSSRTDPFSLLYADEDGVIHGREEAVITGADSENVTLDWENVTTAGPDVRLSRTLFVYRSFGLESSFPSEGYWQSNTFDAGRPVYWNATTRNVTTPGSTSVDIDYSDGTTEYDTLSAVPRTRYLQYNVSLSGAGGETPVVDWLNTTYRAQALEVTVTNDTTAEFQGGTTTDTTITGDGNVTLAGDAALGEAGTFTTTNGTWQTISFDNSYTDPVVVGTVNTENDDGEHALTFDARNVASGQAEMRVCETMGGTNGCETHGEETVGYLVVDAAVADTTPGIEAGTVDIFSRFDDRTESPTYDESHGDPPVVLANVQTANGEQPVETRVIDTSTTGFTAGICHQETDDACDAGHEAETVGWVALNVTDSPFVQDHTVGTTADIRGSTYTETDIGSFAAPPVVVASTLTERGPEDTQIDEVRDVTSETAAVRYCEIEDSDTDGCDSHTNEDVGWVAVQSGTLFDSYLSSGEYVSPTLDAGRRVDWQGVTVGRDTPSGTSIDLDYSPDGGTTWYDAIGDVPDSAELHYRATLSGGGQSTPRLDTVTVTYEESGWRTANTSVADGNWHHVAATYDGADLSLYVDGERDRTVSVSNDFEIAGSRRQVGGESSGDAHFNGELDALQVYNRSLLAGEVADLYNASTNGTMVTIRKSFRTELEPDTLELTNVSASVPSGTSIDVVVESDPNGDGNFEEQSTTVSLDGSGGPYDVVGLSSVSRVYRLRIDFETDNATRSPTLDEISLRGDV